MSSGRLETIQIAGATGTLNGSWVPGGGVGNGWIPVHDEFAWALAIAWTGTAVGNFSIQATPQEVLNLTGGSVNPVTGNPVAVIADSNLLIFNLNGTTIPAGGAAGSQLWERLTPSGVRYIRLGFAFSSSTGTLTNEVFHSYRLRDS